MSTLLEQASLVMIPSGYKEDTVYSAVPTDGSGDLSFTRASNGTRVNSAGLVEVCPWNLNTNSENFTTGWGTDGTCTVTNNFATAPNGTTTAAKIASNGGTAYIYKGISLSPNVHTLSVYVKASASATIVLSLNDTGGSGVGEQTFNVNTEWQRIEYDQNITDGASVFMVMQNLNNGINYFVWGAQLNIGATAKPYFPTTDRLNVPRLTYQNGGGGCPSLLLEKQSTNELTYSEQIQNAAWNVIGGDLVVTGNAVISPDGTQNAGAITLANSANRYFVHSILGLTGGVAYTYSVYMKSASGNLSVNMGGVNGLAGVMKTVTTEWQRFTYTFTPATSYGEYFGFDNRGAGSSTSGTLYFWGAQIEQSSYPTSYIPTTTASATRVADAIGNQTTSIAQAFTDNTKGTIFFDLKNIKFQGGAEARFRFGNTADALQFAFFMDSVGLGVYGYQGGGYAVNVSTATNQKIAIRFDGTSLTGFSQGVKRNTVTAGTNYVIEQMVGNDTGNLCLEINEFVLFNSVLTDAECIALTTL